MKSGGEGIQVEMIKLKVKIMYKCRKVMKKEDKIEEEKRKQLVI